MTWHRPTREWPITLALSRLSIPSIGMVSEANIIPPMILSPTHWLEVCKPRGIGREESANGRVAPVDEIAP